MHNIGLARSRSLAKNLIEANQIELKIDGQLVKSPKASLILKPDIQKIEARLLPGNINRYVSRGGLKLEGALKHLNLDVSNLFVLDVGLSTGGFSHCLLQHGVKKIIGIDVGMGQLAPELQADPRLISLEKINARDLSSLQNHCQDQLFDLAVIDLSFISITLVTKEILRWIKPGGSILSLIKPQFEVGPHNLARGGIVKDPKLHIDVKEKTISLYTQLGLNIKDYFDSPIEGGDGNKEYFIFAQKN